MTNTQFYFALGVPFFTLLLICIAAMVADRAAIGDPRSEVSSLRSEMHAGFSDLRADLGGRMERIERRLNASDTEIRVNHDHRLAVLEARVLGCVS